MKEKVESALIKALVYLLSPILYQLTHREKGKSFKDYIEFLKGN